MKKVFITGVTGFIGSNLACELIKRDYKVIGVDNFLQGFKRNIESLLDRPNFKFCESDGTDNVLEAAIENKEAIGQVFNIGNEKEIAIIELARIIWRMVNSNDEPLFEFVPYQSFSGRYEDVPKRMPDISKAKKLLNFKPRVELEERLPITIEWQRQFAR